MPNRIEGTVIEISNQYDIVMNRGGEHGVTNDMEFVIFTLGGEIEDPETGDLLGPVEHLKARVKPKHIQPRITTLRSDESTDQGLATIAYGIGSSTKSIANQPENSVDTTVQVGDKVRQTE